jgi:hypothetical protein
MTYTKQFRAFAMAAFLPLLAMTVGVSSSATAQSTISITEWQARAASVDARMTALNARIQSVLAKCSGSYPVEELSALQAQCDQWSAELTAEKDRLMKERDELIEQKKLIDAQ